MRGDDFLEELGRLMDRAEETTRIAVSRAQPREFYDAWQRDVQLGALRVEAQGLEGGNTLVRVVYGATHLAAVRFLPGTFPLQAGFVESRVGVPGGWA